ncbi:hypothetical protein AT959_01680 [Dechloromonas denitrificans]|uniref:Uncharacterized protein n=1 Tax=Dechloromonas denitrificans TaxID=281362 RepID=A0A133XNB9_9RHOO|nr:hypothetical protein [Dechloromonas denitrificans]KXB32424.1 hypothetical protein AT959_01680 [Dechloromonas denitrificans]
MMHRYFDLIDIAYNKATLVVRVIELLEGNPDGYVGRPLTITEQSQTFRIEFDRVTEFRTNAEQCFTPEGTTRNITPFVFECVGSKYASQACPLGAGAGEAARHFVVFTESVVVEVLSLNEPTIEG